MQEFETKNVGSIIALSVEADLPDPTSLFDGEAALQMAREWVDLQLSLIRVASTQPGSFIAIKFTAFYPPHILKAWSLILSRQNPSYNDKIAIVIHSVFAAHHLMKP
jgi:hypothetical protein